MEREREKIKPLLLSMVYTEVLLRLSIELLDIDNLRYYEYSLEAGDLLSRLLLFGFLN